MAQMSLYLYVSGGLSLLFALFFHVAYTTMLAQRGGIAALRLAPARLAGVTSGGTATIALGGGPAPTSRWTEQTAAVGSLAVIGTWVGWALLALSLLTRAIIVGRGPWGSMFEFSVAFAFGITTGYLYLQRRYPIRALGFIPTAVASFLLLYAFSLLLFLSVPGSSTVATFEPLVPALDNAPLLTVHVAMAMISYGIFSVSFAAAIRYLLQRRRALRLEPSPRRSTRSPTARSSSASRSSPP